MHKLVAAAVLLAALPVQDGPAAVRAAVEKTRAQKSYTASFTGEVRIPKSDPLQLKGEMVWVTPGVLFLSYTASGGDEVRVVRVGEPAWLFHLVVEDWVPAEEAGKPGVGRGMQNPDEVLSALLKVADRAKAGGREKAGGVDCDRHDLALGGADLEDVMKNMANRDSFKFAESSGAIQVWTGADGRVRKLDLSAKLASKDDALKGQLATIQGGVEVRAFDHDYSIDFSMMDPATKKKTPIVLSKEVADAIRALKGVPAELLGRLDKLQGK